jgi:hypothetical protein
MGGRSLRGYAEGMFGYVLATIVGLLLIALCLGALGGSRARVAGPKRGDSRSQPAADEPTPDRSVTAKAPEVDAARQHTPPA